MAGESALWRRGKGDIGASERAQCSWASAPQPGRLRAGGEAMRRERGAVPGTRRHGRHSLAAPSPGVGGARSRLVHESLFAVRGVPDTFQRSGRQDRSCLFALSPGIAVQRARRVRKACSFAEDGLKLFRGLEHGHGISEALFCLVKVLIVSQSGKAVVHRLLEECLALARETGDESRMADALHVAARGALSQGVVATARSFIEESLAFSKAKGYRAGIIGSLAVFGQVTATQGDYAQARALYEESLTLAREMGFKRLIPANLEGLAAVFAAQGEPMRATRLWGAAEALREAMGMPLPPIENPGYKRSVAAARIQLGGQIFTAIWAEGRTMIPEEVLAAWEPVKLPQPVPREQLSILPAKSSPSYPGGLTAREVEVLRLMAQGLTDAQIAEQLMISPRTVSWHLSTIYNKIQVSSRSAATRYAIEQRMV